MTTKQRIEKNCGGNLKCYTMQLASAIQGINYYRQLVTTFCSIHRKSFLAGRDWASNEMTPLNFRQKIFLMLLDNLIDGLGHKIRTIQAVDKRVIMNLRNTHLAYIACYY